MAQDKIDVRGWIIQVSDGAPTPTWFGVGNVNEFTINPSENEEDVDTTVFSSAGIYEGQKMQRGSSLEISGFFTADNVTGAQEPGQARITVLAGKVGTESLGAFRFRHTTSPLWTVWTATVSLGDQGGGNNDKTSWSATLMRSGPATTVAV